MLCRFTVAFYRPESTTPTSKMISWRGRMGEVKESNSLLGTGDWRAEEGMLAARIFTGRRGECFRIWLAFDSEINTCADETAKYLKQSTQTKQYHCRAFQSSLLKSVICTTLLYYY